MSETVFKRAVIVGVGLIGGSMAHALRKAAAVESLLGVDVNRGNLEWSLESGLIDGAGELEEMVPGSDLVILSTPVRAGIALIPAIGVLMDDGAVLTDCLSVKRRVVEQARASLPRGRHFVGGHPMAGSDETGPRAADPYLFENAFYILTPDESVPTEVLGRVSRLVSSLGARVLVMDPAEHDAAVAAVSHLPQLAAVALVNAVRRSEERQPGILGLAAGGFRDTTRIAASPVEMWLDIFEANRELVLAVLKDLAEELGQLQAAVASGDKESLGGLLDSARQTRASIPKRTRGLLPALYEVLTMVPDQPGIIGSIGTSLGERGVNIADIEILRVREGEGGTIRLGFSSQGEREKAIEYLRAKGFYARAR